MTVTRKTSKSTNNKRYGIVGVIIIVVIVAAFIFADFDAAPRPGLPGKPLVPSGMIGNSVGDTAPDFTLMTLDGEAVSLSGFRGQDVIVNFWATWCPFCVDEMPEFQRAMEQNENLVVLGVNLQETDIANMKRFVQDLGVTYPLLLDPDAAVRRDYNVFTQPVTYFINENGVITERKFGPLTEEEIREKAGALTAVDTNPPTDGDGIMFLEEDFRSAGIFVSKGTAYTLHPSELMSGGPGKGGIGEPGGIPALVDPKFVTAKEAGDWMASGDLVLGLNYNGVKKAYPIKILNWHEIVNDMAGDKPVLVTFCPLCRTGIAFDPVIDSNREMFGVSGKLFNSDLVMYDSSTSSYWPQVRGEAVIGQRTGTKLKKIPMDTVRWYEWKMKHPDTLVLSQETGFSRPYSQNDIYGTDREGFSGIGVTFNDDRLKSNALVHGVVFNDAAKAYHEDAVKEARLLNDKVGDVPLMVVWDEELKTVKIFLREAGQTFTEADGEITDNTGKTWTVDDMEMDLERVPTFPHFWFAWLAFYPDTGLYI